VTADAGGGLPGRSTAQNAPRHVPEQPGVSHAPDRRSGPDTELATEWPRALAALHGAAEVCLACHVRPDGDALGSMLAVAQALRSRGGPDRRGAAVIASFGDVPFEVPRTLRFLPGTELLSPPRDYPQRPRLMVTFDAGSADRLGLLAEPAALADELIVVDHHAYNTRFGTINLVDPRAAATAVLAADLIARLGVEVTKEMALGLYAGLVTDTGSFRHAATSPGVHELAARLLQTGIEPAKVAQELWGRAPFGYLGLLSLALARAELEPAQASGHGLVWTTVTRGDRIACGLSLEAAESVIDVVRAIDEADVAVVLKESDDGEWLVSARSKGLVDVGRACAELGGGGHVRAAGFTAAGTPDEVMAELRGRLGDRRDR
jgi:bifunctional oligoribonuclease and PAP phosphatase NrnA